MLVKGFIPPFLASFAIALFVLVMQTLWLYIDDIIGKGAGTLIIMEFLLYLSFSMIPWALPIGVLLAGVFLFGNLGERYELSSMKSAGISLLRIMLPLIVFAAGIAFFSYICSEHLIPRTNLKFLSRLHDLKKQKPTLSLQEGEFNEDFYGFVIRIGKKSSNGKDIQDILIYDHSVSESNGEKSVIVAKEGSMYVTKNNRHLVMQLSSGTIYQEPSKNQSRGSAPFVRTSFKELTKVFDLGEFDLDRTDEELFKGNQRMKNSKQLRFEIDTMQQQINNELTPLARHFIIPEAKLRSLSSSAGQTPKEANEEELALANRIKNFRTKQATTNNDSSQLATLAKKFNEPTDQQKTETADGALKIIKDLKSEKNSYKLSVKSLRQKQAKHIYELYTKHSYAMVCFLFIFVGAPLGAIVRKGGYGYPLLLCISVFVIFILMNTFCKRLSEGLTIDAQLAAWIPCLIMIPPGIYLTWTAVRDRQFIQDLILLFKRKK